MQDTKLTENFWLSEFIRSETAERLGIDNTPTGLEIDRLRHNAKNMETVRAFLACPIHVLSGLRVEQLERVLCQKDYVNWCARHAKQVDAHSWTEYFADKAHPQGIATDFTCLRFGSPFAVCTAIAASEIAFDKLIFEHTWTHIAWPLPGDPARRIVLTQIPGGYAQGIVEKSE